MTPKEIRQKTIEELKHTVKDLREELFRLKMQDGMGQLEKSHRLKELKKDIARALTIINEKKCEQEKAA